MISHNIEKYYQKLLIWVAVYDPSEKRDQYVLHHLSMAKNICDLSTSNSSVRLFIGTRSHTWNITSSLNDFRNRNSHNIIPIINTNSSDEFIIIEHFKWSCVEFIIGYYTADLQLALPFQHRKYFQQHINDFDWFWYTEDDLLYDSSTYWKLVKDTSFTFNTLSSAQTNDLLTLYADKANKPKLSSLKRYYFLPTLLRFEKPENDLNNSTIESIYNLDLWRLSDMGLCCQPLIDALIFFNEQWWLQSHNSHSAYYLLPREHLHLIIKDENWLGTHEVSNREWIASFWLLNYGYIRVASITNFYQYLVHHASNKYYNHEYNLPKASIITQGLNFKYEKGYFFPAANLNNSQLFNYTINHTNDIASCFPLSFSLIPDRLHEAIPICDKLLNMNKTN